MTRKDYVLIAQAFKDQVELIKTVTAGEHAQRLALSAVEGVAHRLAKVLRADNERFDRERFMSACGF